VKVKENNTYSGFYKFSAIVWIISLSTYFILKLLLAYLTPEGLMAKSIEVIVHPLALFGIFGIPVIVLLSLPVRVVEYFINKL
tara:strand:- start:90 stop:338 length:249 start_codon:yes stop_codon:yes gene_type:complete